MTRSERVLWHAIRDRRCARIKFRRQVPLGQFVADFCCMELRLIVEVDGDIHEQLQQYDQHREQRLQSAGFTIIRFRNEEISKNLQDVLRRIAQRSSPLTPLHRDGEGDEN